MGSLDIENAFYAMRIDDSLSDRFTLPAIRMKRLSFLDPAEWGFKSSDEVLPCLSVLPMG